MKQLFFFLCLFLPGYFQAQGIDVLKYSVDIHISGTSDTIRVRESITLRYTSPAPSISLDLASYDGKYGMMVTSVWQNGIPLSYKHKNNLLMFRPQHMEKGSEATFNIDFFGIPSDGLVMGKNRYGDRTIFGDNWPNRAHLWFACVDHPSDKALVDFTVTAPANFTCVSNGAQSSFQEGANYNTTVYSSSHPLPTKVMVIGLARLSEKTLNDKGTIPVKAYVYPQESQKAFHDLEPAMQSFGFLADYIGPYPFEKLFHVQSTTRFGGMENAGCIFYDEMRFNGEGNMEDLIAHETAHQWFGNSATESDWPHVWLSEGFATYMTNLYLEHTYGEARLQQQMARDRDRVIRYSRTSMLPIVDTISTDLMSLLNPNSYQKGAWVLHMLRGKIGDEAFHQGIRDYYSKYAYSNASTRDFMQCMEKASDQDLDGFFQQWLYRAGHPVLKADRLKKGKYEMIRILQQQDVPFGFTLDVELVYSDSKETVSVSISEKETIVPVPAGKNLVDWSIDPQVKLLYETYTDK